MIPLYLSLLAWVKTSVVSTASATAKWIAGWLTPKLALAFFKNSLFQQLRSVLIKVSTHLFVKSHTPWRRGLTSLRLGVVSLLKRTIGWYLQSPLWLRSALALALLLATASSSYLFIALLVIPQAVTNWLRKMIGNTLSKLGVTRLALLIWNSLVPQHWRHRLYMYNKWVLGRHQIQASRRVTRSTSRLPQALLHAARRSPAKDAYSNGHNSDGET